MEQIRQQPTQEEVRVMETVKELRSALVANVVEQRSCDRTDAIVAVAGAVETCMSSLPEDTNEFTRHAIAAGQPRSWTPIGDVERQLVIVDDFFREVEVRIFPSNNSIV